MEFPFFRRATGSIGAGPSFIDRIPLLLIVLFVLPAAAPAAPQEGTDKIPAAGHRSSLETLTAITETIAAKKQARDRREAELAQATDEDRRRRLTEEISTIQSEIRQHERSFESIATGLDLTHFGADLDRPFKLSDEFEELLEPIIEELKTATAEPREVDRLRKDLAYFEERVKLAGTATAHIRELIAATTDEELLAELRTTLEEWDERGTQLNSQARVARYQLDKKLSKRKSLIESTRSLAAEFFRTRGLNLLTSLAVFLVVFFGLRLVYHRILSIRRRGKRTLLSRLVTLIFYFFALAAAVVTSLLVLYVAGDWVLLGLVLILLFGVAWTARQTIPRTLDEIRLLLNLGPVRENERLVFNGIPWLVSSLNVYTTLRNPSLTGGEIRLPVRTLCSMHSRPCGEDELWFPCCVNDWVILGDEKRGRVLYQSPELVQIVEKGGSRVTYPTGDFLGLHPRNLSAGFRQSITFGIDYQHQPVCTESVPDRMAEALSEGLEEVVPPDRIRRVRVEFKEAGASSLDYEALIDFDGGAAAKYEEIGRAIQRILVDTCNAENWVIPFTQVTIHGADSDTPALS